MTSLVSPTRLDICHELVGSEFMNDKLFSEYIHYEKSYL